MSLLPTIRAFSSTHVVVRFALRMVVFSVFAAFAQQGFTKALTGLLTLAAIYCLFVGGFRREAPLGSVLTHFDEAAAYALCMALASWSAAQGG